MFEALFVDEYMIDLIGSAAYRRAKPDDVTGAQNARQCAHNLLAKPHVMAEVDRRRQLKALAAQMTIDEVIGELGKLARANLEDFLDRLPDGRRVVNWQKVDALSTEERRDLMAAVSQLETEEVWISENAKGKTVKRQVTVVRKLKLWDKRGALSDLREHLAPRRGTTVAVNTTPGGTSVVITDDPAEAAKAYQKLVTGNA